MMTLWEVTNQYQALLSNLYDHETGEINQEVEAELSSLSTTAEDKCVALASWIKNMQAEKAKLDYMKEQIALREAAYEKEIGKRLDNLKYSMERCRISEIKSPWFTLRIKKNPWSTDIIDESVVPGEFIRKREIVKVEEKPDKIAIRDHYLKTGNQVQGAIVQQRTKLEILTEKI